MLGEHNQPSAVAGAWWGFLPDHVMRMGYGVNSLAVLAFTVQERGPGINPHTSCHFFCSGQSDNSCILPPQEKCALISSPKPGLSQQREPEMLKGNTSATHYLVHL